MNTQYFWHVIRAQNFCTHTFDHRIDGKVTRGDQEDCDLMTLKNGQGNHSRVYSNGRQKSMVHEFRVPQP